MLLEIVENYILHPWFIFPVAPDLQLDAHVKDRIVVHAGGVIRIIAYVSGKPPPTITWQKDERALPAEATIEETAISSSMVIKNCKRSHQGIYNLIAKNAGGERKKTIIVDVLGKPQTLNIYGIYYLYPKIEIYIYIFNYYFCIFHRCARSSWHSIPY